MTNEAGLEFEGMTASDRNGHLMNLPSVTDDAETIKEWFTCFGEQMLRAALSSEATRNEVSMEAKPIDDAEVQELVRLAKVFSKRENFKDSYDGNCAYTAYFNMIAVLEAPDAKPTDSQLSGNSGELNHSTDALTIADYEKAMADNKQLVRELDVLLCGEEGAAKQASLCDIVSMVRRAGLRMPTDAPDKESNAVAASEWNERRAKALAALDRLEYWASYSGDDAEDWTPSADAETIRAALTNSKAVTQPKADLSAPSVSDGWQSVPKRATFVMERAALESYVEGPDAPGAPMCDLLDCQPNMQRRILQTIWTAMLAAAPQPPALPKIEGLAEALEYRKPEYERALKIQKEYYGMNKDRPRKDDIILYEAARAYYKLTER